LPGGAVSSATVNSMEFAYRAGRFQLVSDTYLDAPAEAVFRVLTDYDQFGRLSSLYTEYGFTDPASDGTPVVFTTMEACVLFFCKRMRRVERLETYAPRRIRTVTLPERSDFRYGESEWILEPHAGGTKMIYRLEVEPDFWVPPLLGVWLVEDRVIRGGERVIGRIERYAREISIDVVAAM
jgi:hypothetical protein